MILLNSVFFKNRKHNAKNSFFEIGFVRSVCAGIAKEISPFRYLVVIVLIFVFRQAAGQKADVTITFDKPAAHFTESSPVGNGRLGAMVFGDPVKERIVLNEISLWSGGPQDADNDSARFYLKPIQDLLLKGDNKAAQVMLQQHFVAKGAGSGLGNGALEKYGAYQTAGDLFIAWMDTSATISEYHRKLDLEKAVATTTYRRNGNKITERVFADFNDDVIRVQIQSEIQGGIWLKLSLNRRENARVHYRNQHLMMEGRLPSGKDQGMRFAASMLPRYTDGKLTGTGNEITIEGASEIELLIAITTDYDYRQGGLSDVDVVEKLKQQIETASAFSFETASQKNALKYATWFNRCRLFIPGNPVVDTMTTYRRLVRYAGGASDPQLPVLYFNFGRYLLISSSRTGLLPANLQGLWAEEYQTPWNGDYHLNINLQMNYWLAGVTGLGDLEEPLFRFTGNLVQNGKKTSAAYYNGEGWVAHVISNPWFYTSPGEGADWGSTLTGGAWLCAHIWEHFRFTNDTLFLRKYYPVMKGAAQFLRSVLIREPAHGWLVTAPSNSPENTYVMPDGFRGQTAMGPAMDMQICREIFGACAKAAGILETDEKWREELKEIIPQLAPDRIGREGDLNEWLHDWKDADPHHRHVSHLYGLYPYDEITPWDTPVLSKAAIMTLQMRGDGGTGWSKAWKINFWARLGNGDHAFLLLKQLLKPVNTLETVMQDGGGTYPNLFCAHPPFQIDGNFGGTAGIAEMLIQSHGRDQVIRFLPALPRNAGWSTGSINGLRARGNFIIGMSWSDGKLYSASVISKTGSPCRILLPEGMKITDKNNLVVVQSGKERVVVFETKRDERYFVY